MRQQSFHEIDMYHIWLHRIAVLTAVMTFILICMGGLVTSTDSGLAVPDWPTTFGYNMFLYPLSKTVSGFLFSVDPTLQTDLDEGNLSENLRSALENNEISISENAVISTEEEGGRWRLTDSENERTYTLIKSDARLDVYVHGVLYEHTHRLIGSIVGVLTILLLVAIWAKDDRRWLILLGAIALLAVIVQGVMGGLRVTHLSRALAIVHACFAQVFFGLTASLVLFTSRGWLQIWQRIEDPGASRLRRLSGITLVLIYVQFIFGAILRHTGTRLDAHLLFAALVTIHVFLLSGRVLSDYLGYLRLVRPVLVLSGLLAVQLVLGGAAYVAEFTSVGEVVSSSMSVIITTAHVAIGALMLVMSVVVTVSVYRLTSLDRTP